MNVEEFAMGVMDEFNKYDNSGFDGCDWFYYSNSQKYYNGNTDIKECDVINVSIPVIWGEICVRTIEAIKQFGLKNGFKLEAIGCEEDKIYFDFIKLRVV